MSELDRERLRQTTVRQVVDDPKPTWRERMRLGEMRVREAARAVGRWASRNASPQPVQVNVNQPQAEGTARPTAARTFPTDGGMTPNQRLETIANDVAGPRAQPQPQHTPWHQTEQGRATQEKYAQARQEGVRQKQQAEEKEQARQEWVKKQHQAWQREQKQKAETTRPASPATQETAAKSQEKIDKTFQEKEQAQTTSPADRFGRKEYGQQPKPEDDTRTKKGPQPKP